MRFTINKAKAIELLDEVVDTLTLALTNQANKLTMASWVGRHPTGEETIQTNMCGTAACVCGYVAINRDVVPKNASRLDYVVSITEESRRVSEQLRKTLGVRIGESIYDAFGEDRYWSADKSKFFTNEELEHPHLTNETTLTDALDFVKLIKSKFEGDAKNE